MYFLLVIIFLKAQNWKTIFHFFPQCELSLRNRVNYSSERLKVQPMLLCVGNAKWDGLGVRDPSSDLSCISCHGLTPDKWKKMVGWIGYKIKCADVWQELEAKAYMSTHQDEHIFQVLKPYGEQHGNTPCIMAFPLSFHPFILFCAFPH